jgi:tellurium resistance protein TerD
MNNQTLTLNLLKPGEEAPKLQLSLNKGARFIVELFWDSKHDLDAHALMLTDGKVSGFDQVLSTYNPNLPLADGSSKTRESGDGRPFTTPEGALKHHGDARDGTLVDVDEVIEIDGSKMPAGVNEVPIFVTIHPTKTAKFDEVKEAGIRIKDGNGAVLGEYKLSDEDEFGEFDAVQMGSLILGQNGWEYAAVGVGLNGDFNAILANFS